MDTLVGANQLEPEKRCQCRLGTTEPAGRGTAQDRTDVIRRVEGLPGRMIGILPFRIRHPGMMRDAMIEVILVHVGIHPGSVLPQNLVILRPRQWSEEK